MATYPQAQGFDLGSILQAAQLGRSLNPEVMQQQALGNQLALQLQQLQVQKAQQQVNDLLNPEAAALRNLSTQLKVKTILGEDGYIPNPNPGQPILAPLNPQQQAVQDTTSLASKLAGFTFDPIQQQVAARPVGDLPYARSLDERIRQAQEESMVTDALNQSKYNQQLALLKARATNPRGYAPKYYTDAKGFRYTIDPETNQQVYITDSDGNPVNDGVANRYLGTENGYFAAPVKSAGGEAPVPTQLLGENNQPIVPASVTTAKNTAERKIKNDLYKAVQSNAEVKEFETISRNFETLNSIVEDVVNNPDKINELATGRDTAAIDAFNIVFNPKGVVRQFSYVNTLQNRPLLDQGWSLFQRTLGSGGKITPEDLKSMRNLASMALENSKKSVKGQITPILNRAKEANVPTEDILPDSLKSLVNQPSGSGGMVRVISPGGKVGSIPEANLEGALKAGYKRTQ